MKDLFEWIKSISNSNGSNLENKYNIISAKLTLIIQRDPKIRPIYESYSAINEFPSESKLINFMDKYKYSLNRDPRNGINVELQTVDENKYYSTLELKGNSSAEFGVTSLIINNYLK